MARAPYLATDLQPSPFGRLRAFNRPAAPSEAAALIGDPVAVLVLRCRFVEIVTAAPGRGLSIATVERLRPLLPTLVAFAAEDSPLELQGAMAVLSYAARAELNVLLPTVAALIAVRGTERGGINEVSAAPLYSPVMIAISQDRASQASEYVQFEKYIRRAMTGAVNMMDKLYPESPKEKHSDDGIIQSSILKNISEIVQTMRSAA